MMKEPGKKKKVIICEDHEIVYTGLKLLLDLSENYSLAGLAKNGNELIPLLKKQNPEILILDLNLPDTDGFSLLKSVREFDKEICIVILTMYQDEFLVERAREEGANAYLLKNAANYELIRALDHVTNTSFYLSRHMKEELEKKKLFHDSFTQKMKLTKREVEIIRALALGNTSEKASIDLNISQHTVDTHRKNIFRKLEINNLASLVRFAYEHKII
ncbi:MAG: response regulator transcription factor [Bacteroidia bacterium]|nr:response regulator transcription factor [Bacteroidia bacterium]